VKGQTKVGVGQLEVETTIEPELSSDAEVDPKRALKQQKSERLDNLTMSDLSTTRKSHAKCFGTQAQHEPNKKQREKKLHSQLDEPKNVATSEGEAWACLKAPFRSPSKVALIRSLWLMNVRSNIEMNQV
jgi:hypothetical protein